MRFRWFIIALALLASLYMLFKPPVTDGPDGDQAKWSLENIKSNVRLGLDLQGGIFMQLEVDEQDAVNQFVEEEAGNIKATLESDGFTLTAATSDLETGTITMGNVASTKYPDVLDELKNRYDGSGSYWSVHKNGTDISFKLKENAKSQIRDNAVKQTVDKIQGRVDELGVTEPVINRMVGSNRIVLELAGADDVTRVHKIVREPGKLEWRLNAKYNNSPVPAAPTPEALLAYTGGRLVPGAKIFPMVADQTAGVTSYMMLSEVMLSASNVSNVRPGSDDRGLPAVSIQLDHAGGNIFQRESGMNIGNQLAIVLDGNIISAPVIQSQLSHSFIIQGSFTQQEVEDLVVKIRSGSLPAKVEVLEERTIGPTLGRDAIRQGIMAAVLGLILVVVFILAYYRRAGVYAFFALVLNLIFMMGMLAWIGAVLTLPGIAGFILTIGMAVDANVLIFERIREELRDGTAPKNAIEVGYKTAFVTIMDANITTFLAAFCLLLMGEGPIKGFAVMLMIGIVSSIFTAVFCSRTFFMGYIRRKETLTKLGIFPIWQSSKA